eukprot:s4429_g1.t1
MLHTGAYRSPFGGQKLVGSAPAGCTAESLLRVAPRSKLTAGSPGIPAGQAGWRLEPRGRKEASGARRPKSEARAGLMPGGSPGKGSPAQGGTEGMATARAKSKSSPRGPSAKARARDAARVAGLQAARRILEKQHQRGEPPLLKLVHLQMIQAQESELVQLRSADPLRQVSINTPVPEVRVAPPSDTTAVVDLRQLTPVPEVRVAPPSDTTAVVDLRQLGKPETFKGEANEFSDWSFILKSYLACINHDYVDLLDRAEQGRSYRLLWQEYSPKVASRFVGSPSVLWGTKFGQDFEGELAAFEQSLRQFESESGKQIDEEFLLGVIINGLTDQSLGDHVIRNAARLTTYSQVKAELLDIARTNRVIQQLPQPMDIGALPNKGGGKGKDKGKGGGKGKDKGKGGGKGNPGPTAAAPEDESEPVLATPTIVAGTVAASTEPDAATALPEILVDTGAGSHRFQKGFDPEAVPGKSLNKQLVTVTGEALHTKERKKSELGLENNGKLQIEYFESEQIKFFVMSVGEAAEKGFWTVIGAAGGFLVPPLAADKPKQAVKETEEKLALNKRQGVYWLPVSKGKSAKGDEPSVVAATRAAKTSVPASVYREEADGEAAPEQERGVVEGEPAQGSGGYEQELPALSDEPPPEVSEAQRRVRRKKIAYGCLRNHMITHLPLSEPLEVAKLSLDYCFFGRALEAEKDPTTVEELKQPKDEQEGAVPALVVYDHKSGATFSGMVNKGVDPYGLAIVTEALKICGVGRSCGQELGKGSSALQTSAKGSHQSNGAVERAILENAEQVRTVINAFEMWLVRHSSWLISRFLVKSDGKTPYERLRGREYRGEVVEPCEVVHYKLEAPGKMEPKTAVGVWLFVGASKRWDKTVRQGAGAVNPQPSTPAAPPAEGMDLEAAPSAGDSAEVATDRMPCSCGQVSEDQAPSNSRKERKAQAVGFAGLLRTRLQVRQRASAAKRQRPKAKSEKLRLLNAPSRKRSGSWLPRTRWRNTKVKRDITWEEARVKGLKIVRSRWVDGWKAHW